jgi:UDP-N-acetylglucosamine transferase subunit ALG13
MHLIAMVGTDHHPFQRLVDWVDSWAERRPGVECVIQFGTAAAPRRATGTAYVGHDELGRWMDRAAIIVSHAGPSTILEARQRGHRPIVVPRQAQLGEHVDDHQSRFASRLADLELVLTATTQKDFDGFLDQAVADPSFVRVTETAGDGGTETAVRRFGQLVSDLFP